MAKSIYSFRVVNCLLLSNILCHLTFKGVIKERLGVRNPSLNHYSVLEFPGAESVHAECPVWDPDKNWLYWVDPIKQNLHYLDYHTSNHGFKHIGYGQINIVIPVANSSRLLVAVRSEIYLLDLRVPGDAALRLLAATDIGKPDNVLNEGKADALGRFWGGTKGPQSGDFVVQDEAAFYSLQAPEFAPQIQLKPVSISNGLAWSLNNSILYYIDSSTKKIDAFDFDLKGGHLANHRTILDTSQYSRRKAIPDGMTIDKHGFLWVAIMFDGMIFRIDPDNRIVVEKYVLPVSQPTSLTWAGPRLGSLVVATSRKDFNTQRRQKEWMAGAIFVFPSMRTAGVNAYKLKFDAADQYSNSLVS